MKLYETHERVHRALATSNDLQRQAAIRYARLWLALLCRCYNKQPCDELETCIAEVQQWIY